MSTGYNWNLSDLFAYFTATPACPEADTLCRATTAVGLPAAHLPQFAQDGLTAIQETTGIAPAVTSVAVPALAVATGVAIYKTRKDLATLVSEAVYEAIKDNKALVKAVKGMNQEDLNYLNRFTPETAQRLSKATNMDKLVACKNKKKMLENYVADKKLAILDAPAETKAQADAKKKAPAKSWVPGFARVPYIKLPSVGVPAVLTPSYWKAPKKTA